MLSGTVLHAKAAQKTEHLHSLFRFLGFPASIPGAAGSAPAAESSEIELESPDEAAVAVGTGISLPHDNEVGVKQRNALVAWVAFAVLGLVVYREIAEGAFTSILTLSVIAQALSFMVLQVQISASKSVAGISAKTLGMHVVKLLCRLWVTLFFDRYLPTDKTGDWVYQVADAVSLLMVLCILYRIHVSHKASYQAAEDSMDARKLILGAFVLAVLVHPKMAEWTYLNILWAVHLYIDAIAMLPQLWMLPKVRGQVRGQSAHYIAATLLSNLLSGLFWFYACPEFAIHEEGTSLTSAINITGLAVNGAHVVQVLLLLDFGYFYCKARLQGRAMHDRDLLDLGQVIDI